VSSLGEEDSGDDETAEDEEDGEDEEDEDVELLASLDGLTVQRLKKELKDRDLPVTGTKQTLVERLGEHLEGVIAESAFPCFH